MASGISIPSPSVFLRPSSPPSPTAPASQPNAPKAPNGRRPGSAEAKKKAPRKGGAAAAAVSGGGEGSVVKPKQSKSRNGIYSPSQQQFGCLSV
jgi:hypothetical protein